MSRRRSKETIELVIRPESAVPEDTDDYENKNSFSIMKNRKKKKKKKKDGRKLCEKGQNKGAPRENNRKGLHTIIEEDELEDLNKNVCNNRKYVKNKTNSNGRGFLRRKSKDKVDALQELHDDNWHAGWAFLIRSACPDNEASGNAVIVCTEYDTVDSSTSVGRVEDDELLHAYRKRPRRNAVCEAGIGSEERLGLKRILTHYCHMLYLDKYGLG